jgi:hypothetical protein
VKATIPIYAFIPLALLTSCVADFRSLSSSAEVTRRVATCEAQSAYRQKQLRVMADEIDRLQEVRLADDNEDIRGKLDRMKEELARLKEAGITSDPSYVPPDATDVALSPELIAQLTESKQPATVEHLHPITSSKINTKGQALDVTISHTEAVASQLADAIVAWKPPAQMVQGTATIVSAAIAYTPDYNLAVSSLEGVGPLRLSTRQVTETVYVLMTSDESGAFRIEKFDDKQPDEQLVRSGAVTYWQWRVTPLIKGQHTLRLQPYLVFVRGGAREKKQRIAVPPEIVSVTISRPYQIEQVWKEQRPTILSVFIFPFVTWGMLAAFRRVRLLFGTKPPEPPLIITG